MKRHTPRLSALLLAASLVSCSGDDQNASTAVPAMASAAAAVVDLAQCTDSAQAGAKVQLVDGQCLRSASLLSRSGSAGLLRSPRGTAGSAGLGALSSPTSTSSTRPLRSALAASSASLDANALLDWAERGYPDLFPDHPATLSNATYVYRYYPSSQNYLGVADGKVYVLGPVTGNELVFVGQLSDFTCAVQPASCALAAGSWRFAVVGDTHVPSSALLGEMAGAMIADGVKLALFPGDIVESGASASASTFASQLASWKSLAAPLYRAGIGVYPIRGNHENDARQSIETWNAAFAGAYLLPANGPAGEANLSYAFGYKNALFVGLDQYVNIHRVNQGWLDQQLAANTTRPHVFVFGHEPAFKVFHTDNLDDYVAERDTFWQSLSKAGARTYFSGHDHFFDLTRIDDGDGNADNDLYQVVVGAGGGDLFDRYRYIGANSTYTPTPLSHLMVNGYLLVEISGESNDDLGVTLTFKQRSVDADGGVSYRSAYSWSYSAAPKTAPNSASSYKVVDTGQTTFYNTSAEIAAPSAGAAFYGQDAQYQGPQPSYRDNGDGTVSDLNTGLMWVKARGSKLTWSEAAAGASASRVGGYSDWRMPSVKELYSLIKFTGAQGPSMTSTAGYIPFIDTASFDFVYGSGGGAVGERVIDSQDWSANQYVGRIMSNQSAAFGVNFADGRIKGYPLGSTNYVRYVRANPAYGVNAFVNNGDGTVTDAASGLMWAQSDSAIGLNWQAALDWVQQQNAQAYLGYTDWRLPNTKELQSIVDYSRAPLATDPAKQGPAIDPIFQCTAISNEAGQLDYPFYWSSTSFKDGTRDGVPAAYVAFGRALGYMQSPGSSVYQLMDVHGAGTQRSDPKAGSVSDYLLGRDANGKAVYGRGPQGDVVRIANFVRLVRDARP